MIVNAIRSLEAECRNVSAIVGIVTDRNCCFAREGVYIWEIDAR